MLHWLLRLSAVYLGLLGIGFLVAPTVMLYGLGADSPPLLLASIRATASTFLGIAILNWGARDAGPSPARRAIILGNGAGISVAVIFDVWMLAQGAPPVQIVFTIINLAFALGFFWSLRAETSIASAD